MQHIKSSKKERCLACGDVAAIQVYALDGAAVYCCQDCSSIFVDDTSSRVCAQYHDADSASFYNAYFDELRKKQAAKILSDLQHTVSPPADLLDVGCGNGVFVEACRDFGYSACGIDVSLPPTEYLHAPLHVSLRSIEEMAASGQRFDVVTVMNVLEHISQPAPFLDHVLRAVKPGGILVFSLPLCTGPIYRSCQALYRISCGAFSTPWKTLLQWHTPSPHVFLPTERGLRLFFRRLFGGRMKYLRPQAIVHRARLWERVQYERSRRSMSVLEPGLMLFAGNLFAGISTLSGILGMPDEIYCIVEVPVNRIGQ